MKLSIFSITVLTLSFPLISVANNKCGVVVHVSAEGPGFSVQFANGSSTGKTQIYYNSTQMTKITQAVDLASKSLVSGAQFCFDDNTSSSTLSK